MSRVAPLALAAMLVAACSDRNPVAPVLLDPPDFGIYDGNNGGGNPDFFFLPPLVPDPSSNSAFEAAEFNEFVRPAVHICELGDTDADGKLECVGTLVTFSGDQIMLSLDDEHYHVNWHTDETPALDPAKYYRIRVLLGATVENGGPVGGIELGFADVDPVLNMGQVRNVNTDEYIALVDGRTLPIKFRIENGASCGGATTCSEKTFTNDGGVLTLSQTGGDAPIAGVSAPSGWLPQAAIDDGITEVVFKLEDVSAGEGQPNAQVPCHPQLRALLQDGRCIHFTTVPDLTEYASGEDETGNLIIFAKALTLGICPLLSPEHPFFERLDPYRSLDDDTKPTRLPAVPASFLPCDPTVTSMHEPRAEGFLGYASAGWRAVRGGLARFLTPRSAYAVDLGVGGSTLRHSFYAFAVEGTAGEDGALAESYAPGTVVSIAVRVEPTGAHDDGGEGSESLSLAGVSVLMTVFEGGGTLGSTGLASTTVLTDATGVASMDWNLGAAGVQRVVASVGTGNSVTVTTTAAVFLDDLDAAESTWDESGFWNLNTLVGVSNVGKDVYVTLPDDGALPQVFGVRAYWYGAPSLGNFLGTRASGDEGLSGGTSASPNDGRVTSPLFNVPASSHGTALRFDTWFEIEGVNPSGYDVMTVSVLDGTGATLESVTLNPDTDPTADIAERVSRPFGSNGYNVAPAWQPVEFDLTAYEGSSIRLQFAFDTRDQNYNGFRGWVVDNVRVVARTSAPSTTLSVSSGSGLTLRPVGDLPESRPAP